MNHPPSPVTVPARSPGPTPGWLRTAFALAPAAVCTAAAMMQPGASTGSILREGGIGLAAGGLFVAGLALAERFFAGRAARLAGGAVFAVLLAVGGAAVGFAGCIPYPTFHRVPDVRAAPVPRPTSPTHSRNKPAPSPSPSPSPSSEPKKHVEVEWHGFPWY